MTTPDRDPFKLLSQVEDQEPDPAFMRAVIAQSREAFEQKQARDAHKGRDWLRHPFRWLVPATAGAFALVAAVVVVPGLMQTPPMDGGAEQMVADAPMGMEAPPTLSRGDDAVVSEPPLPAEQASGGIRMGAQPPPAAPMDAQPAPLSVFAGENVQLGFRHTPTALLLYLPDISTERPIETQGLVPGEDAEILAAFGLPEDELVAVQLRVDDARFWRAYSAEDGVFARDADLSALVSDAPDAEEAQRRLLAR